MFWKHNAQHIAELGQYLGSIPKADLVDSDSGDFVRAVFEMSHKGNQILRAVFWFEYMMLYLSE